MNNSAQLLQNLKPKRNPRLIDLVRSAGFGVADWGNFRGGDAKAATNPKYCYEWCFEQNGMILINIWYENLKIEGVDIFQNLNFQDISKHEKGPRSARAKRFDLALRKSFETGYNPRAIILDRTNPSKGPVERKDLDTTPWTVVAYDFNSGRCKLKRGIFRPEQQDSIDLEIEEFPEGKLRTAFVRHRLRERKIRCKKIEDYKSKNGGRLMCEVPGCGFDFYRTYRKLGQDYAQVHHKVPLGQAPDEGIMTNIDDLAIVCANCHAMIHRGGQCRELHEILPRKCPNVP